MIGLYIVSSYSAMFPQLLAALTADGKVKMATVP